MSWPRRVGAGWWLSIQRGRNSKGHFPKIKKTKVNSSYLAKDKREMTQIFLRRDKKTNDLIWPRPSLVEELSLRKIDPALVWKKRLMKVLPYLFSIDVKLGQRWWWCQPNKELSLQTDHQLSDCFKMAHCRLVVFIKKEPSNASTGTCKISIHKQFVPNLEKNTCKASRLCTPAGLHRSRPVKSLLI